VGGVGDEDTDDVVRSILSDPVENLSSGVEFDSIASSHHDQAERQASHHGHIALRASPDVDELGERQLGQTADNAGHDSGGGGQGVEAEVACNVCRQAEAHTLLKRVDECDDPDPGCECQWVNNALKVSEHDLHDIGCDQVLLSPDLGRRFHLLHAGLGISVNGLIVAVVVLGRDRAWLGVCSGCGGFFRVVFMGAGVLETGIVGGGGSLGFTLLGLQCSRSE
jgi:hypothetical protein